MSTGRDEDAPECDLGELDAITRSIEELDAIRRRVINVVGHALRTPVTTIAGMANALGATDDEATRAMLVDGLARNSQRVELLLDDLLLAAGVSTALPAGDAASSSVCDTFAASWSALGGPGDLSVLGPDLSVLARCGAFERIAHVVLDNALKYGHGPIRVSNETTSSGVRIEVESVGDALSDDELEHAFELFYRGEHAVMTAPGLGIGLAVARQLARAEGGEVGLVRRNDAIVATVELPA
ncbi:MAG: two-component system, OmpR family, phosphate regulon sensor histidine kinase PhoR [Acidimicrobiaceae bacterium]|jgi:signal transduction histidine kinase